MGELRGSDLGIVAEQLGREPTIPFVVVARCADGHPLVIRNAATDAGGRPFPTTYWLTCAAAVRAVSRQEADGWITRINERVERIDRTQAEPVAKLTRAIEAFERRDAAKETTGSITPPQPAAAQPPKQPGIVEGWVLREVERGTALIEGRMGIIEVDPGDVVPGLGRIEAIRKQDGRWVVVTSKGLIVAPLR